RGRAAGARLLLRAARGNKRRKEDDGHTDEREPYDLLHPVPLLSWVDLDMVQRSDLTSKASRKPSPIRLNARVVMIRKPPGNSISHQATSYSCDASVRIDPQDASSGGTPRPRYESAASKRMFEGINSVE